jgi:5S rRNA maturation endonuclease (ribonuclease M5)/KaiC/GvpD/RAD55 family RecA-like ATPase
MWRIIMTDAKEQLKSLILSTGAIFKGDSCTCPFHRDRNPSAGIYQSANGNWRFKCQVCEGLNFDAVGFEAQITGKSVDEIIKGKDSRNEVAASYTEDQIRTMFSKDRGFKYLHEYKNAKGEVTHFVACKYDGEHKKFTQISRYGFNFVLKNNSNLNPLFRLDKIKDCETVVMVEGEKCVYALEYIGIDYASTTMGGAKNAKKTDLTPLRGKRVIIWPDNDKVGKEYMDDLIALLTPLDCTIGTIDPNEMMLNEKEDVADYVQRNFKDYSKEELKNDIEQTIAEAKTNDYFETHYLKHMDDLRSGVYKSLDIGWDNLSKSKWLQGGTVTTLCAKPGVGKTWFVHNLSIRCMERGIKVANIQLEDSKEYHINRILMAMASVQNDPDLMTEEDLVRMTECRKYINEISKILVIPEFDKCDLVSMAELIKQKAIDGCKLIILDSVSVAERKGMNIAEADQIFVNKVKMVVKIYKCRVVLVTHPKTTASQTNRDGKQITTMSMDTIAGGTAYQRLSQTILWLHEVTEGTNAIGWDHKGNRAIAILKARNKSEKTPTNKILFQFDRARFNDLGFCDA